MGIKDVDYARIQCDVPGCDSHTVVFQKTDDECEKQVKFAVECLGWKKLDDGTTLCPSHANAGTPDTP